MAKDSGGMNFIEFIGFIVSLVAMLFLFLKQFFEEAKKRRDPKKYEEMQRAREQASRDIMSGNPPGSRPYARRKEEEDEEEEYEEYVKPPPPPLPKVQKPLRKEVITSSKYEVHRKVETSRGAALVKRIKRKELFIIEEIIKPPVTMRSEENRW
jgi:hypothetical protein